MTTEVIVYQVRSIDAHGNERIVHAYETEDQAKKAIEMMKNKTRQRYVFVPVPNQPNEYWGINFPA
jgi:hypothetical protein